MRLLKACLLIIAVACVAQAGEIQNGIASSDTGSEILMILQNLLSLF